MILRKIKLNDSKGKEVNSRSISQDEIRIDLSDLPSGIYFLNTIRQTIQLQKR